MKRLGVDIEIEEMDKRIAKLENIIEGTCVVLSEIMALSDDEVKGIASARKDVLEAALDKEE